LVTARAAWCCEGVFGLRGESLDEGGARIVGTPSAVERVALESGATLGRIRAPGGSAFAIWAGPSAPGVVLAWGDGATVALEAPGADAGPEPAEPRLLWRRAGAIERAYPGRGLAALERWGEAGERDIVDVASGEVIDTLASQSPIFGALEIDPAGRVATVELSVAVTLRHGLHASPGEPLLGHRAPITAACSGRSGFWFGDAAGEIRRWSADVMPAPARVGRANDAVLAGALTPDGGRAFTSGWGMVKAWSTAAGDELWSRWLGREYLLALAATARVVVAADTTGVVTWLDARDGAALAVRRVVDEPVSALAIAGDLTIVGTRSGRLLGVDGAGGALWSAPTHAGVVGPIAAHPDGRWIAVAGGIGGLMPRWRGMSWPRRHDGAVLIVDAASGATLSSLPVADVDGWLSLAFSPDGTRLAGGAADGTLTVWTLDRPDLGVTADRLPALGLEVRGLAFSGDGGRLFVGDEHGTIQIWSVKELDNLATLPGVGSLVVRLAVGTGSERLVAMSERYPLAIFDPRPSAEERARWSERERRRQALDLLVEREGGSAEVVRALAADPALAADATTLAAMARARGDNPNELNSWAWGTLRYPGEPAERVARARRVAELCADGWPRWEFENTRALARLRDGDATGAIASAERSMALGRERGVEAAPTEWAVVAMARAQLGEREAGRSALAEATRALEQPPWNDDGEARAIVDEARRALE